MLQTCCHVLHIQLPTYFGILAITSGLPVTYVPCTLYKPVLPPFHNA